MITTCSVCGFSYVRDLPEDRRQHRVRQAESTRILRPRPTERFRRWIEAGKHPEHVGYGAARWKHGEVYERAKMFRREFNYDFVQWDPHGPADVAAHAFLFNDDTRTFGHGAIAGACGLAWRDYTDAPPGWAMTWVWIAPDARRKGILQRRWPRLVQRFGLFRLEHPISEAMQQFVARVGHPA